MLIGGHGDPVYGWTAERIVSDDPQGDCPQAVCGLTAVIIVPVTISDEQLDRLLGTARPGTYVGMRRAGLDATGFKTRFERQALRTDNDLLGVKLGMVHELDAGLDIAPQATSHARWHGLEGSRQRDYQQASEVFGQAAHVLAASFPDPELLISGTSDKHNPGGWLTETAWFATYLGLRGLLWTGGPVCPPDDAWEEACRIAALSG